VPSVRRADLADLCSDFRAAFGFGEVYTDISSDDPDVLPDEADYTRALSLSRVVYDMESLTSPILAAGLLTVISFHMVK
jgi:hypothetical protein